MEKSIWQKYNNHKPLEKIENDMTTDIVIIGAGITGITCAYNLIDSKYNVIVIDRGKCFNEVTAKSTGKVTYLQELIYQDISSVYDFKTAKKYYDSQKYAIDIIKNTIKKEKIDCDFEKVENITFTFNDKEIPKFIKEEKILDKLGVKYSNTSNKIKTKEIKRLISIKDSYVFNPVKYLSVLLKRILKSNNIKVYENSIVTSITKENEYFFVKANNSLIRAKKVLVACNYPFFTFPGLIPLKTYVEKSYICALKVNKNEKVSGITNNYPTKSFRYYEDKDKKYFIYLNNSSSMSDKLNYKKNYKELLEEIKSDLKKVECKWENMDVMTNDYLPLIGRISDEENMYISTGYNTWGMTNGVLGGKIISDIILEKENEYIKLFDPSRKLNLKTVKNFFVNTAYLNSKAYILNFVLKNPSWYKDKAMVTKIKNKRVGIYFDKDGNKHIVSNICPHLKCFLTFNEVDKTWDCPCHASRFDIDGNAIKGPSCYNIKIDETK